MNDTTQSQKLSVVERRANLSYAEFERAYLYANKPVVITDALRDWKAISRWSPEFFKTEFGSMKFSIEEKKTNYPANGQTAATEYTMAGFIDRVVSSTDDDPAPYFRNQIFYERFPSLNADIEPLPSYFLPNWLPESFLVPRVQSVFNRGSQIEIYIGGKGGTFPVLHYDGLASHAFLMQIYGRKEFILYSPDQEQYLYPSPERENLSLVNSVENPDLVKYPRFAKAVATKFVLEPGELLFIPSHWWHTTKMLTACISVSVNTVNESNWPAVIGFLSMRRRNAVVSMATRAYLAGAGSWRSRRDRRLSAARRA